MSLWSRLFGERSPEPKRGSDDRRFSDDEKALRDFYVELLVRSGIFTREDAVKAASDGLELCKREAEKEGTTHIPSDFGDRLLAAANEGVPGPKEQVRLAKSEGATEKDIREWWNMPDLGRRMINWSEEVMRLTLFMHAQENGLTEDEAAAKVHGLFPTYGDPVDTKNQTGESRRLPHELRIRIDIHRFEDGLEAIKPELSRFPSFNAYVRHAIRKGLI